jgi:hypothetical protein
LLLRRRAIRRRGPDVEPLAGRVKGFACDGFLSSGASAFRWSGAGGAWEVFEVALVTGGRRALFRASSYEGQAGRLKFPGFNWG